MVWPKTYPAHQYPAHGIKKSISFCNNVLHYFCYITEISFRLISYLVICLPLNVVLENILQYEGCS